MLFSSIQILIVNVILATMSGLFETGRESTESVLSAFHQHVKMEDFLWDDELKVPIHYTTADPDSVRFSYDIDGVVIQVKELYLLFYSHLSSRPT